MKVTSSGVDHTIAFKPQINKLDVTNTIDKISTDGKITKDQFKKLAGSIEGGKESLSKILADVSPETDIKKLKEFTFKRDGKTEVTIDTAKLATLQARLGELKTDASTAGEDTSYLMLNRLKSSLKPEKINDNGDCITKSCFISVNLSASVGATSQAKEGSPAQWALGLTGTEVGVAGEVNLTGSLTVQAEKTSDGVSLSFEGRFTGGASLAGSAEALGVTGIGIEGNGALSLRKKVTYTFSDIDQAKKFLENEGKGFASVDPTSTSPLTSNQFKRNNTGAEIVREGGTSMELGSVPTTRTTKNIALDKMSSLTKGIIGSKSLSKQSISASISASTSEGVTKTYALDTSSGAIFVSKKKTSTQLSLNSDKAGTLQGGAFSVDINLSKIKNNRDKEALVDKLSSRFNTVSKEAKVFNKDVTIDNAKVKEYIRGTIDKLIDNKDTLFAKGGRLDIKSATSVDVKVSAPVPVVPGLSVSGEVSAKWGNMIRIHVPFEVDATNPKKLTVPDTGSIVQVYNEKGGALGVGAGYGVEAAGFGLGVRGGVNITSTRKLFDAELPTPPPVTTP